MCEFCENIYENGEINGNTAFEYGGMSIIEEDCIFKITCIVEDKYENEGCWTVEQPINYCPICGRKLEPSEDDVSIENKEKFVQIMRQLTAKRKE